MEKRGQFCLENGALVNTEKWACCTRRRVHILHGEGGLSLHGKWALILHGEGGIFDARSMVHI